MKVLKQFKCIIIVVALLFAQIPQVCSIDYEQITGTCIKTAVIGSVALASSAACLLGLTKILHPSAVIKEEKLTKYCSFDPVTKEYRITPKNQANGIQINTTTTIERPLYNKNEAIQGTVLFAIGICGLSKCWHLAQ